MFKASYFTQRAQAAPYHAQRVRYWDRAATAGGGCYTAGTLLARSDEGNWYVEHVVHGQWDPDTRDEQIVAAAMRDRRRYAPHHEPVIWIEQEPGSSGVDAYRHTARKLAGFRVGADRPTGAKEVRAEPWASQCAAKNVFLVDDGTWDVESWINEHCLFPLGKFKDRVDSASGAFGKLVNSRPAGVLRVYGGGQRQRNRRFRIVVGSEQQFAHTPLEQGHLVVVITDPPPLGRAILPPTSPLLLDSLVLAFADLDPANAQETWEAPIAPYDRPAAELIMTREMGKKIWSLLLRKRDPIAEVFVLLDDNERRALSIAYAIADVLTLPRTETIYSLGSMEWSARREDVPPNRYLYEMTKGTRGMVI
jgi:predicted phage terminase large subunit-like protein